MAANITLPPGFKFCPTDKELILHHLYKKVMLLPTEADILTEVDLYNHHPWELPGSVALAGNREWYFYSKRKRSQRKNSMEYRSASSGYWLATSVDEPILTGSKVAGYKASFVFVIGNRPPLGTKTNWVMHEYSLVDSIVKVSKKRGSSRAVSGEWVLCRVQERELESETGCVNDGIELSCLDEIFVTLDELEDQTSLPKT